MCQHRPPCPPANAADHAAARTVVHQPEQGWSLLCNGVVLFDDTGELLPDGRVIHPHPSAHPGTALKTTSEVRLGLRTAGGHHVVGADSQPVAA